MAYCARSLNEASKHDQAKALCDQTLAQLSDAHREYLTLFLMLDLQLATADAGLKNYTAAFARFDALIKRFAGCDHPLLQGSLHEARARICLAAGDTKGYDHSRWLMEHHFRSTHTPALVAKCEQLTLRSRARGTRSTVSALPARSFGSNDK